MSNNIQNTGNNPQPWVLSAAPGHGAFNYAVVRPPHGSVLPIPPQQPLTNHQCQPVSSPRTSLQSPLAHQLTPQPHTPPSQTTSLLLQHQQQLQQQHQAVKFEDQTMSLHNQAIDFQQQPPRQAPQQQQSTSKHKPTRAVIPSKRAAQNRAAQKAFRQRREQYIKELEQKAKEMDEWHDELDNLRKRNSDLQKRMALLEKQIVLLTGGDTSKIIEIDNQLRAEAQAQAQAEVEAAAAAATSLSDNTTSAILSENELTQSPERELPRPLSQSTDRDGTLASSSHKGSTSPVSSRSMSVASGKQSHTESRLRNEQLISKEENRSTVISHDGNSSRMENRGSESEGRSFTPASLQMPNKIVNNGITTYNASDQAKRAAMDNSISESPNDEKRRKLETAVFTGTTITNTTTHTPSTTDHVSIPATPPTQVMNTNINSIILPIQHQQQDQQQQQQIQNQPQNAFWNNAAANPPNAKPASSTAGNNAAVGLNAVMGNFDLEFDFDPFFEDEFGPTMSNNNNDFLANANSGQVLDDLFAMLQTRQRPQIPLIPTEDNLDLMSAATTTSNNHTIGK
ncbi:hypothetical protein BDF20DRAFT_855176 [Mycotypha africana]|uniref:uncharacterized protein n=1 Tax=Mycotypha africana TaxID=64632 RepID=UPI00230051DC|nr:uncharacterized protein BDF20DRAFT_855176 [Mycotypha africana]KAI8988333.1 hypothetical protein BDF20DRAFT_855176 [Mycotypha africana]